ncbi:MAG TPA: SH3 domain-containing protein, partial [Xanthobacteraceae bacterium]|nr:SH3 domain-containing protein [Xanthobacteraceae bacterium]
MSKRFVLSACAVVLLSANAVALPGVAVTTVNLRAEANTASAVLAKMPAGARLDIGDCKDGWCAVTFRGTSGFAIQTALDATGRARAVRRALPPGAIPVDPDDDFVPVAPAYRP